MLNIISNYCSVLGFIISLGTFVYAIFIEKRVRNFEKTVLFNTRIPILIDDLKRHTSELLRDLSTQNEKKIKQSLNFCKTIVEVITPKLPNELSKSSAKVKKSLEKQYQSTFQLKNKKITNRKFWITITTVDDLWTSYNDLNSLITKIDYLKEDKKIIP